MDFGKGFYLTAYQKQAEKWALRKALRKQKSETVNVYELSDDLEKYNREFTTPEVSGLTARRELPKVG